MEPTSACSPGSEDSTSHSITSGSPASDRLSTSQPALPFLNDTGPESLGGETSTTSLLLPTPSAEKHSPQRREDFTPNLTYRVQHLLPTPKSQEGGWTAEPHHRLNHRAYQQMQDGRIINRTWGIKQTLEVLTSSSADTPANPSPTPASAAGPTIRDTSGPSSPVLLASFDPDTRCWRTFQATLASELPRFSQTLPRSGMTRHGRLYELRTSALRTDVSVGSALLHSPTASDKDGKPRYDHRASPGFVRNKPVPNLAAQIVDELLPTPTADHSRGLAQPGTDYQSLPNTVLGLGEESE